MTLWSLLSVCAVLALGGGIAVFYGQGLASRRADALRRAGDHGAADATDQVRFDLANPAALPMRVQGFDRPR